jgi:hypothetical protein
MKIVLHTSNQSNPTTGQLRNKPSTTIDLTSTDANISLEEEEAKAFFEERLKGSKAAIHERKI